MSATPQDRPPTNHRKRLARQGPAIAGEQPKKRGIAEANDCVVVTENERDFAGVKLFKPDCRRRVARAATPAGPRVVSAFEKSARQPTLQAWRLAPRVGIGLS